MGASSGRLEDVGEVSFHRTSTRAFLVGTILCAGAIVLVPVFVVVLFGQVVTIEGYGRNERIEI
jgi:hypothetical protein